MACADKMISPVAEATAAIRVFSADVGLLATPSVAARVGKVVLAGVADGRSRTNTTAKTAIRTNPLMSSGSFIERGAAALSFAARAPYFSLSGASWIAF